MQINTHLFYDPGYTHTFGYQAACWTLWIVEDGFCEHRQNLFMSVRLPAKPTKKQIRKLRRQFRKSA